MKKPILILFLIINCSLLIINTAVAQDVDKALEYFNAEQYEQAALYFENVLPSIEEEYGYNDTSYYTKIILYTALSYERALNYQKAEEYYLQGISIYKSIRNGTENSWYATYLNNIAELYCAIGN